MIDTAEVIRIHKALNPVEGLAILESTEVRSITHPDVPEETLSALAGSPNTFIQALVAANTQTPAEALTMLSTSSNEVVLGEVVRNANTPQSTLMSMAMNEALHPRVAMLLANGARTPWEALRTLIEAEGQDAFVKFSAMTNPNVPGEVLAGWAQTVDALQVRAAAVNPSTPPEALARLYAEAAGLDVMALDGIARNPSTPSAVLVDIATKALIEPPAAPTRRSELSPQMRAAIQAFINPSFPHDIVPVPQGDRFHTIRINLARTKNLPDHVLHQLTHDITMHGPILHHKVLPQTVLNVLLESPHGRVRYLAASHPSMSPVFVQTLIASDDPFVRAGAALQQSYETGEFSVPAGWAVAAANDASAAVRESVACRPDLPMEAYLSLINDPDNNVRKQALKTVDENNLWRFLSDSAVLALACDPNPDVRTIAKEYFLSGEATKRAESVVLPWTKISIPDSSAHAAPIAVTEEVSEMGETADEVADDMPAEDAPVSVDESVEVTVLPSEPIEESVVSDGWDQPDTVVVDESSYAVDGTAGDSDDSWGVTGSVVMPALPEVDDVAEVNLDAEVFDEVEVVDGVEAAEHVTDEEPVVEAPAASLPGFLAMDMEAPPVHFPDIAVDADDASGEAASAAVDPSPDGDVFAALRVQDDRS